MHVRYRPYNILSKQKVKITPSSCVETQIMTPNGLEPKSCIQQFQENLTSFYQEQKVYGSGLKQKSHFQQDLVNTSESKNSNNQLSQSNETSD